ncbi:MAG: class I SAM-dependent methyltransferase [Patescibacteria group bacterium]
MDNRFNFDEDPVLSHASFVQRARIVLAERPSRIGSMFTRWAVQGEICDDLNPETADPTVTPVALLKFHDDIFHAPPDERYRMLAQPVAEDDNTDQRVWFDVIEGLTNHAIINGIVKVARELLPDGMEKWQDVADLGAGTGKLGALLLDKDARVSIAQNMTFIDKVPELLEVAKKRNGPNANYVAGDVLNLAIPDGSFDLMVSGGLVYSLGYNQQNSYFQEVSRLLKPGGVYLDGDQHKWRFTTGNIGRFHLLSSIQAIVSGVEITGDPLGLIDRPSYFAQFGLEFSEVEFDNDSSTTQTPVTVRILRKTGPVQPDIPPLQHQRAHLFPGLRQDTQP